MAESDPRQLNPLKQTLQAMRKRLSMKVGTLVLGFVVSNLVTALAAFLLGFFGGAYLEVFFRDPQGTQLGYVDATFDFTKQRTFRAYYGNYHGDTGKTEIVDALLMLREGSRTGKFTGTKIRAYDNHPYTLSGFTNGVDIVLSQRGDDDAHGEAILLLKIALDNEDKHEVYYGYEITEDVEPNSSQITLKKCPLLMIEESTFQATYKTMDRVRSRYPFLDAGCADFAIPLPFASLN